MSLSLRAFATSTSWPQRFSSRLTQGEWVPASIATRIGSEPENRRSRAFGLVERRASSITSPLSASIRHSWP
jgi:hypothetical protein